MRIINLPESEFRSRCLSDAKSIGELSMHLDMLQEDGEDVKALSVSQILEEARDCLGYFENGTAADSMHYGDKNVIRECRRIRNFVRAWESRVKSRLNCR